MHSATDGFLNHERYAMNISIMNTKNIIWLALLFSLPRCSNAEASELAVNEWFLEPSGLRVVNQPEVAGVIRESSNLDLTQIFTVSSSGLVSAIGVALGGAGGTPSLTTSLYRVSNGILQPSAFATSFRSGDYFEGIGPQTVPVWVYAEFTDLNPVTAGEQIAFRIQSPLAELWGPRSDVLPGAELVEIPGTDLAFRAYLIQAAPSFFFINVGTNLVLNWPSSVTNGAVEATASVSIPMSWSSVHAVTAATNQYWAPIESGAKFFRIRIP